MARYWGVKCKTCAEIGAVLETDSDPRKAQWKPDKKLKITCPHCGAEHDYDSEDLQLYEGETGERPI